MRSLNELRLNGLNRNRLHKLAGIALAGLLCLLSVTTTAVPIHAQNKQPLPAPPPQSVLDKVIRETGGAQWTQIGVPPSIAGQILSIALALNPALPPDQALDLGRAVYYFGLDKALKRVLVPMANADKTPLAPTMKTPDGAPAQIVGAGYDFSSGPYVLMVAWKDDKAKKPQDLRVYTMTSAGVQFTTPYKLIYRKLKGSKAGQVAPLDKGVIIAARETCFTLGTDQICYAPTKAEKRADAKAGAQIDDALKALTKAFDVKVKIDSDGALPEIAGVTARTACAARLTAANSAQVMVNIPECAANMAFAGVTAKSADTVIGALVLLADIDQPAYDFQGNALGRVAAGTYLMVDATPAVTDPGAPGVLMLVNADGKTNFLIPSQIIEGFGDSDDASNNTTQGQAAIKDATVGVHGF